jgi:hypothetical protein
MVDINNLGNVGERGEARLEHGVVEARAAM